MGAKSCDRHTWSHLLKMHDPVFTRLRCERHQSYSCARLFIPLYRKVAGADRSTRYVERVPRYFVQSRPHSRIKVTRPRPQSAPERLQRDRGDAPLLHAECKLVQPRKCACCHVARCPVRQGCARPEDFRGRRRARPHDRVEVRWGRLFCPQQVFACRCLWVSVKGWLASKLDIYLLG